jgi:ADP-heptose:LPS heptosyltransferase
VKILVVRFSSIGDIVLTSPVVRAISEQVADAEIHYLTKSAYSDLVSSNPRINKVITIEKSIDEVIDELKKENYDHIVDLHNNVRTRGLKFKLRRNMTSFPKLNYKKWMLVRFKRNSMPDVHVVDRYFEAAKPINVEIDGKGIEFYIDPSNEIDVNAELGTKDYVVFVLGAKFNTKRIPDEKLVSLVDNNTSQVVLIGGPDDKGAGEEIVRRSRGKVINLAGKYNLQQSASILKQSKKVLTGDTGMMHIASAFNVPIISVWGNTVPDLGMYPYKPNSPGSYSIHEVKDLSCRPCSKIGFAECPKGHFKCMNDQNFDEIQKELNS